MEKFWTVTDGDTLHTNSRSSRYGTKQGAISEATSRIQRGKTEQVYILEAVTLVRHPKQPIEIVEIEIK